MNGKLEIRRMMPADIDILHGIENEVYGRYGQRKEGMLKDICDENAYFFGAYFENEMVGFCSFGVEGEYADIWNIALKEAHRHNGYGRLLLKKILETAASAETGYIEAYTSNKIAMHMYESEGFRLDRKVENFYGNGDCAHVMKKEL